MNKPTLRSILLLFSSFTLFAYGVLRRFFPGPPGPSHYDSLLSLSLWKWVLVDAVKHMKETAHIALPIGFVGAGIPVGLAIFAEAWKWARADSLLPVSLHETEREAEVPTNLWRTYDVRKEWVLFLSGLLGLSSGLAVLVYFSRFPSTTVSFFSGLGLSVLVTAGTFVSVVGWSTTAIILFGEAS